MLIYDGFEAHLNYEVIQFLLSHRIIAFFLPAHSSHRTQPLDVAVFSSLSSAYKQEVSRSRQVVKKKNFPHILAIARAKGCTASNACTGFRKCGLVPFNPTEVLSLCRQPAEGLPLPSTNDPPATPETFQARLNEQDLLEYTCSPPTTPHKSHHLYQEAVDLTTTSPRSHKLRSLVTALKTAHDRECASTQMAKEGERQLHLSLAAEKQKSAADKRRVPQADGSLKPKKGTDTLGAQVLEQGNILISKM